MFVASTIRLFCICSYVLLEARGTTEAASAPEPIAQRPQSTPYTDAREVEDMMNFVLRDSPLPDAERSNEKLPKEEGGKKLPEEIPTGKLVMPLLQFLLLLFYWFL